MEQVFWETFGKHLESIWEPSEKHLGTYGRQTQLSGVAEERNFMQITNVITQLHVFCKTYAEVLTLPGVLKVGVTKYRLLQQKRRVGSTPGAIKPARTLSNTVEPLQSQTVWGINLMHTYSISAQFNADYCKLAERNAMPTEYQPSTTLLAPSTNLVPASPQGWVRRPWGAMGTTRLLLGCYQVGNRLVRGQTNGTRMVVEMSRQMHTDINMSK